MSKPKQQTIRRDGEIRGVGLHTGADVRMRVRPAAEGSGVRFRRTDIDGAPEILARVEAVVSTDRGTTLDADGARVHTVEHLLAAVAATGIDNLVVELDAEEVPVCDGSAAPFVELLRDSGTETQSARARVLRIADSYAFSEGNASYVVAPAAEFRLTATIEFDHALIGRQTGSYRIDAERFAEEIAFARTFGFLEEVEALRSRGRATGGSAENAVVLTGDGLLEGQELRAPDEFVRHKALDLIGDLALLGARIEGHIVAEQPGHRGNIALAREIERRSAGTTPVLDIQQILHYLPHRYPLLLVDRVIDFERRKRIVGIKNVTINEPFFVGHFPGRPVMPGVLIIEAMAQVGGLLLLETLESVEDKIVYFMSLDNVKWRRPVTPGDQIRFEVEVLRIRGTTCRMRGVGLVDGSVVAEAEMMARVVDR